MGTEKTRRGYLSGVKREVSSRILAVRGVSGIGLPDGTLTVYLEYDSEGVRNEVRTIVKSVAPTTEVAFLVSGSFRAHQA